MINIQHVTTNHMEYLAKKCMAICPKGGGLAQKGHSLTGCSCIYNKVLANCCVSLSLSESIETDMSTVFHHRPKQIAV